MLLATTALLFLKLKPASYALPTSLLRQKQMVGLATRFLQMYRKIQMLFFPTMYFDCSSVISLLFPKLSFMSDNFRRCRLSNDLTSPEASTSGEQWVQSVCSQARHFGGYPQESAGTGYFRAPSYPFTLRLSYHLTTKIPFVCIPANFQRMYGANETVTYLWVTGHSQWDADLPFLLLREVLPNNS